MVYNINRKEIFMDLKKVLVKNSDGKSSTTMTAFVIGFIVVNAKLLASGMTIAGVTMSAFTGSEYAMAIGALGAVYVLRRGQGTTDIEPK